jgi:hypothetical protein
VFIAAASFFITATVTPEEGEPSSLQMPKPVYWDNPQSNPIGRHEDLLNLLTLGQGQPQRHLNHRRRSDGETAEQSRFHGLRARFLWTTFCLGFFCGEWAEVFYKLRSS